MAYVGGLRSRLIRDSLYNMLHDALSDLGWFDSGRGHDPVTFYPQPVDPLVEVRPNAIGLGELGSRTEDAEMGTNLGEFTSGMYVDVFAQNETVGLHLIRDIQDIIQGRFPSIGRWNNWLQVYDYTMATPPEIFTCEFENVAVDRAQGFTTPWQKLWWSVSFDLIDTYGDEDS